MRVARVLNAAPAAAQRLEYRDLILHQYGVGCGDRFIRGDQRLLGGQEVQVAQ